MARETSVVTPQRFEQGFSYPNYIDQIKVNKNRFNGYYTDYPLKSDDAAHFRELAQRPGGPAKMMVLGEDWCGDVVRGLPVLARIAEAAGIEMSIFPRDLNPRHYERVPQRGTVDVHTLRGVLHQGPSVYLPLD